ncbi:MAG: 3-phosphoshikimate 1-carboxyvinyltransferase [Nitrospirota bacterium]
MRTELRKSGPLRGDIVPPADKSISHRAIIIASLADGESRVSNFLRAGDTLSTLNAMRALGVDIDDSGDDITVRGKGLDGLREPLGVIDCGNSGTTMRLLSGVLAGNPFFSVLTGDESLRGRPMGRVIIPLRTMGAEIRAREDDKFPPMAIRGGNLKAISYEMPVASAQVKSCILLAGLYAEGATVVTEPGRARDHTERMLPIFGVGVEVEGASMKVEGGSRPRAADVEVPGDFSSAAFLMGAAMLVKGSEVRLKHVGLNPLRTGLLSVFRRMGAEFEIENEREISGEPVGDVVCRHSGLKGIDVGRDEIPSMVDEFPVLCALAARAEGVTNIRGAGELRVKESDRISAMAAGLRAMGSEVEEFPDGLSINGSERLRGAEIHSGGDHRVAMAFSVLALTADGSTFIEGSEAADVSFPGFYVILKGVTS